MTVESLPVAFGGAGGTGHVRTDPADFAVDEILGFEPDGDGEHAWLWIRKTCANTEDVAVALARFAGVRRKNVGFSGMKDFRAVTGQWFSVHLPGRDDPDWTVFSSAHWTVEQATRHGRKLRTATHRANRFVIRVRDFSGDFAALEQRVQQIAGNGFPNYFGPQRFGRAGENVRKARAMLAGRRKPGRHLRGLYLSAARSWLFNRVLACRVAADSWCEPLVGDALALDGSHSMFCCTGAEPDLAERIAAFDLHVTGPLWGTGFEVVGQDQLEREREWLADEAELLTALEQTGIRASRRPLRATARALTLTVDNGVLVFSFVLPTGVYATSLLRELVHEPQQMDAPGS